MGATTEDISKSRASDKDIIYFLTYLLTWITGLIVYFTKAKTDKKAKFHSIQAMLLGLLSAIISIFILPFLPIVWILSLLIWIYGLYIGYRAYSGMPANIPYLSDYAQKHSSFNAQTSGHASKIKHSMSSEEEHDALKTLKMRYAKGEITKKKYIQMKKELE